MSVKAMACRAVALLLLTGGAAPAFAQGGTTPSTQSAPQIPAVTETVTVVETTPLPGTSTPIDKVAAPAQVSSAADLLRSGATDLSAFLNTRLNAVQINE